MSTNAADNETDLGAGEKAAATPDIPAPEAGAAEGTGESWIVEDEVLPLAEEEEEKKKRRGLLLLLLFLLLLLLCCVAFLFYRYLTRPAPLPELLPVPVDVNYPPHYLFSIYGVDKPVGVALSPQGDRLYVSETGGDRQIKIFDPDGNPLGAFTPPRTRSGERSPVYLATDSQGRVYVIDRLQHALFVYDRDGNYLDTILSPDLTLSEYVFKHVEDANRETTFGYDLFEGKVFYQRPGQDEQSLPAPDTYAWSPLGVRIDSQGTLLLTDVANARNGVYQLAGVTTTSDQAWRNFEPEQRFFGETGQGPGQLLFPNAAVRDSQGRLWITDGNNGRISAWDEQGNFLFNFGRGSGEGALNLPRGAAIDSRDRLHVVDAVGQNVKVYDVSGPEPVFLFTFGDWGEGDGQFNYPNDIALDASGRLYIADRENRRVQVWSY